MKWKEVPDSWFGFPGKLLQYLIDNVKGLVGRNPDDPEDRSQPEGKRD